MANGTSTGPLDPETLERDYQLFKQRKAAERERRLQQFQQERAEGGSIRQAPVQRDLPLGAIAGGTVGALKGAARGGATGAVIGGALGAATGELGQQGVEVATGRPSAPRSLQESARRMLEEAIYGSLAEVGGRATIGFVGKILKPFAKTVTPEASDAIQLLSPRMDLPLLPAEATESRALDLANNIAESSFFGGGRFLGFRKNREVAMEALSEELIESFGQRASADEFGQTFIDAVNNRLELTRAPARVLYNSIDNLVGEQRIVDIRRVKQAAAPLAERGERLQGIEGELAGDTLVGKIARMDDLMTFGDMQALRTRLAARAEELQLNNPKAPALRVVSQLVGEIDNAIEAGLQGLGPGVQTMWRDANRIWKQGSQIFRNKIITRLLRMGIRQGKGTPEAISAALRNAGPSTIRAARQAAGPVEWRGAQSMLMQDMLNRGRSTAGLDGNKLVAIFGGKDFMKQGALEAAFDPQQLRFMRRFANALKLQQTKTPDRTGAIAIQLTQVGAMAGFVGGLLGESDALTGASIAILGVPAALSHILTRPKLARLLIEGLELPPGSPKLAGVVSRLVQGFAPRPAGEPPQQPSPRPTGETPRAFPNQP